MTGHPYRALAVSDGMGRTPLIIAALTAAAGAHAGDARLLVQSSPLAGFQFHAARGAWPELAVGDALDLVREPDNVHDANAVRVLWRGRLLGYVPRRENAHVAAQLDRGTAVRARITRLVEHRNPRLRLALEIYVDL